MLTTLSKIVVTATITLLLFSCGVPNVIKGKGDVVEQEYQITDFFQHLNVERGWEVELVRSTHERKIVVEANENLADALEFNVEDQTLNITSSETIGEADSKKITVFYIDDIVSMRVASGSDVHCPNTLNQKKIKLDASSGAFIELFLDTEETIAEASSGAEITLQGTSTTFEGNASSGAVLEAKNLTTKKSGLKASSGASIDITVTESLEANSSSAGKINYYGNPKEENLVEEVSGEINNKY